ncbi:MAG TPA: hypothetical protein VES38_06360 [Methylotenera sp.]|nr:hypothetical protein [Methylotenera sp.]
MTETTNQSNKAEFARTEFSHPEWDEPIVCRVEVDLPAWLSQLAGGRDWEVYAEDEEENCISFAMRQGSQGADAKISAEFSPRLAEVTLYHNGYAVVDVEGSFLFDGSLTSGTSNCAHLTYYHADSGEKITLN